MSESKPRRKPLTKRVRFEVFKRDHFTCAYCGAHPPAAILHVDHIHPVSKGGTNDLDNLVTSCSDCNLGKSNRLLKSAPESLGAKAKLMKEREEQLAGYRAVMDAVRAREDRDIDAIECVFIASFGSGRQFSESFRASIRHSFLPSLDLHTLIQHAEVACARIPEIDQAIKYFCGMNWRTIKGD
jgi:hypothetical protein